MTTQDLIKNEDLFSVLGKLRLNKAEVEAMIKADAESDKVYAKLRVVEDLIEILVNTKNRSDYIEDGVVALENVDTGELINFSELLSDFADRTVKLSVNYDEDYE